MKRDLPVMWSCDMVVTMPEWELSKGAALEVFVAQSLGMTVIPLDRFLADMPAGSKPGKVLKAVAKLSVKLVDVTTPVQEPIELVTDNTVVVAGIAVDAATETVVEPANSEQVYAVTAVYGLADEADAYAGDAA